MNKEEKIDIVLFCPNCGFKIAYNSQVVESLNCWNCGRELIKESWEAKDE